jgi:hypothetical protein
MNTLIYNLLVNSSNTFLITLIERDDGKKKQTLAD